MTNPFTDLPKGEYAREVLTRLRKNRARNRIRIAEKLDEYLNTDFGSFFNNHPVATGNRTFLRKPKHTLAESGWTMGKYFISPKTLGVCDPSKKKISFNIIFTNCGDPMPGLIPVIQHEICHAVEFEKYGYSLDTNQDETKRLMHTSKILFDDEQIGYYKSDGLWSEDKLAEYMIIFEKITGIRDENTTLRLTKPKDYHFDLEHIKDSNPGYIQSTIISPFGLSIIAENYTNKLKETINAIKKAYGREFYKIMEYYQPKAFESDYKYIYNFSLLGRVPPNYTIEESFTSNLKGAIAGLGALGATFMPSIVDAAPKYSEPVAIKQNVSINTIKVTKRSSPVDIIAATLYSEAVGEKTIGRKAVASVIVNRTQWKGFKNKPVSVCLAPKQFSGWNKGFIIVELKNKNDKQIWEECKSIAKQILNKKFKPIFNADHYYNPKKANPSWKSAMEDIQIIGNHKFGKIYPKQK